MVIKNFLIHSKSIGKSSYLWNSASAMLNSFQTVVILMVISRIDPVNDAGIFVIAYAIGNLMLTIGRYGIRQFQASDVVEKYSYREYYYSRVLTTGLMLAISLAYIGFEYGTGQYDGNKSIVVLLICLVKWIDAFEDVFHGMLQQHDRLDIGGKILTVRLFLYTVLYMVLYAVTKDLILTSLISLLVSFALFVLLNGMALKSFPVEKGELSFRKIGAMLWECFPLFGSTFLIMYIGNAPKYAIDSVLSNQDQASFNYVFMPVFVISLLSNFIYQPVLNKLAVIWNQRETSRFWKLIAKYIAAILGLTAAVALDLRRTPGRLPASFGNPFGRRRLAGFNQFFYHDYHDRTVSKIPDRRLYYCILSLSSVRKQMRTSLRRFGNFLLLYFIYAIFSVAFLSPVGSDCPAFFQKSVALLLIKEKAAAVS